VSLHAALRSQRALLAGAALACFAAVAAALVSQYQFDMLPCPWCTLQRLIFLVVGTLCGLAALLPSRPVRRALASLALLFSLSGVAAALWQHLVAASSSSCNLTLADKILRALGLFDLAPSVFAPMASCADAAVDLLGVPYALWSLALFGLCGLISLQAALRPR
jgi:protein dithiol:quinone oxidoreductase